MQKDLEYNIEKTSRTTEVSYVYLVFKRINFYLNCKTCRSYRGKIRS